MKTAEPAWEAMCQHWLPNVQQPLTRLARKIARGTSGVLVMRIDCDDMVRQLRGGAFEMSPTWIPAEEFSRALDVDRSMDDTQRRRWQKAVETMNAVAGDVALFLHSDIDALPIVSRLIVIQGNTPTIAN
jgi:hypothetical protein